FLISEEIRARNMSLHDLINLVCDVILKRCQQGMDYGVVLIPESVTDALDELKELEEEIRSMHAQEHRLLMSSSTGVKPSTMLHRSLFETLSPSARAMYDSLPDRIQYVLWQQYVATPPGGQFELPHLESELLLKSLVAQELPRRRHRLLQGDPLLPRLSGNRIIDDFAACCHTHSLHIQGRSAMPSNFDADLGYTMGYGAGLLIHAGRGGLLVSAEGLEKDAADWTVVGVHIEQEALHVFSDVSNNHTPRVICDLPEPSKRRFVNIGPLQYNIPEVARQCVRSLKLRSSIGQPPSLSRARTVRIVASS
ncbi:hypothetical protein FOZ63_001449, partial [Perkinsus olseni]